MTMAMKFNKKVYVLPAERYEAMRSGMTEKSVVNGSALAGSGVALKATPGPHESRGKSSKSVQHEELGLHTFDGEKGGPGSASDQSTSAERTTNGNGMPPSNGHFNSDTPVAELDKLGQESGSLSGSVSGAGTLARASANIKANAAQVSSSAANADAHSVTDHGFTNDWQKMNMKETLQRVRNELPTNAMKHRAMAIHHHFMSCLGDEEKEEKAEEEQQLSGLCADAIQLLKSWTRENMRVYRQMLLHTQSEIFPPPSKENENSKLTNRKMHCLMIDFGVPLDLVSNSRLKRTLHQIKFNMYHDDNDNAASDSDDYSNLSYIDNTIKSRQSDSDIYSSSNKQSKKKKKEKEKKETKTASATAPKSTDDSSDRDKYSKQAIAQPVSPVASKGKPVSLTKENNKKTNWVSLSWKK